MSIAQLQDHRRRGLKVSLALLMAAALVVVLGRYWPAGPDYFFTFRPAAQAWFTGESQLYGADHYGYFGAPWGIFLIGPTLLLPITYGQAILSVGTLITLIFSIHVSSRDNTRSGLMLAAVLGTANLHTFDLLIRGNIDAVLVLGIATAMMGIRQRKPILLGAGLWLLSIKPINVALAIGVIFWLTSEWSRREKLAYLAPTAIAAVISFPLFGLNWPLRYLQFVTENPPLTYLQTSLWRAFEYFGIDRIGAFVVALPVLIGFLLTLRRLGAQRPNWALALSLSTWLTITPYALGSHYVLLAPVFGMVSAERPGLLLVWLTTLTPLLRLWAGFEIAWMDVGYPLALTAACYALVWRDLTERPRRAPTRVGQSD